MLAKRLKKNAEPWFDGEPRDEAPVRNLKRPARAVLGVRADGYRFGVSVKSRVVCRPLLTVAGLVATVKPSAETDTS